MAKYCFGLTHAEIFGVISALLCLIGAFLPWADLITVFGQISVSGIGYDGMITFILASIYLGILYLGIYKGGSYLSMFKKESISYGMIIIGFVILLIVIIDGINVANISTSSDYIYVQVGIGIYLTAIGGIGLFLYGIWRYQ